MSDILIRAKVHCLLVILALLPVLPVRAQQSGIQVEIDPAHLGLGGVVQRGVWTPVRVDMTNLGAENAQVDCRWLLADEDGDELIAQRTQITLTPGQKQGVWLYANPPMSTRVSDPWVFQVVDSNSGELINQIQRTLPDSAMTESSVNLVGICGVGNLGLYPWRRWSTQHEQLKFVAGLNLETLPDRWHGLDGLSSLVWFAGEGGQPTSNMMSDSTKRALREWVYRGGHLVIMMPYAGQQWTSADSGLADLIQPTKPTQEIKLKQAVARPPIAVFGVLRNLDPVPMVWFDITNAPEYTSLAQADLSQNAAVQPQGTPPAKPNPQPVIVGRRYGFGQVTLVGIDLSDPTVLKSLDSFRMHRVWTRIFSWRASMTGELLPVSEFENKQTANQYVEAKSAQHVELGTWVAPQVARQRETGPAVGLAFVLFVIYALAAGLTFPNFLRSKGWDRHSWMFFVGIVALFSAVSWGGAWVMRPASSSAAHFTVLDIDGNTNLVRAKSWQSLLIPSFTNADIAITQPQTVGLAKMDVVNLLSSPGLTLTSESPGYPDTRSYTFDATRPDAMSIPMRSTTKSLVIDYLGQISAQSEGLEKPWTMPRPSITMGTNGLPAGTIIHSFPDSLTDVRIIYCPGGAQQPGLPRDQYPASRPLVYTYRNAANLSVWDPQQPLALPATINAYAPLWLRPKLATNNRVWKDEGFLGTVVQARRFEDYSSNANPSTIVHDASLLSFYDALPPPVYLSQGLGGAYSGRHHTYNRSLMRDLDLTPLITGKRLIIIGHLRNSTSPVPLTVDGQAVDSEGWTVVRWIYDL